MLPANCLRLDSHGRIGLHYPALSSSDSKYYGLPLRLNKFFRRKRCLVLYIRHFNLRTLKSDRYQSGNSYPQYKCYYEDAEDYADDEGYGIIDSDELPPGEHTYVNADNAKSAETDFSSKSPSALSGQSCNEQELKKGITKTNILQKAGKRLTRNGAMRVNSLDLHTSLLRLPHNEWEKRAFEIIRQQKLRKSELERKQGEQKILVKFPKSENIDQIVESSKRLGSTNVNLNYEAKGGKIEDVEYQLMAKRLGLKAKWKPLIQYLSSLGLNECHFARIYNRHKPTLQTKAASAQERLDFLRGAGVKTEGLVKIILKQPQILGYTIENNLKPHIDFLRGLGVPDSRLGKIIISDPSLFSYSLELSLKPRVRFLTEEVGIKRTDLAKVVILGPQILRQPAEAMKFRLEFFSKELGASKDELVKMVTKHPQLLHYSIKDGIQPRINFLRSIGINDAGIVKLLTRLPQILSLSVENNLRPKYLYLVKELENGVESLSIHPLYFSISLKQRIWPRHRFLASLKKVTNKPFPIKALLVNDECFCGQWAHTTLQDYQAFRQLLLGELAGEVSEKQGHVIKYRT